MLFPEKHLFFESPVNFVQSIWSLNRDARGSDFPLVRGGPWALFALATFVAVCATTIGPKFMKNRKPYDLRPYMLIYNGILFGVNGTGFVLCLILADYGYNGWYCDGSNPSWKDFRTLAVIYLGYVYYTVKLSQFIRFVFAILRKRPVVETLLSLIHITMLAFQVHSGLYFYPGGIFCFLPLTDCFKDAFVYGYSMLTAAGPGIRTTLQTKKYIIMLQLVHFVVLLVHGLRFLFIESCAPILVIAWQAVYAALSIIAYLIFYSDILFAVADRELALETSSKSCKKRIRTTKTE